MRVFTCKRKMSQGSCPLFQESKFDRLLQAIWQDAMNNGVCRYKLGVPETRVLDGPYNFVAQLNPERCSKRRAPFKFESLREASNPDQFNFLKVKPQEVLFCMENEDSSEKGSVIINASPFEFCSSLVVPSPERLLNQTVTEEGIRLAIQVMKQSLSPDIRMAYNSLLAYASVNHQHYHVYYFPYRMFLENAKVSSFRGDCFLLEDFPSKGLCFQIHSRNEAAVIRNICKVTNYMCEENIAHNMWITKGSSCSGGEADKSVIRLYLWARQKTSADAGGNRSFNPASTGLAGHFECPDSESYTTLTEAEASEILRKTTQVEFDQLRSVLPSLIDKVPTRLSEKLEKIKKLQLFPKRSWARHQNGIFR